MIRKKALLRAKIRRGSAVFPTPTPTPTPSVIPEVGPGTGWAGAANLTGAPADASTATRTSSNYAKPAARILTEPGGLVLDSNDLVIGIHAYAGNASGPLACVVQLWVSGASGGTTTTIPFGSYSYTDANGNARTIWGYFAKLKRSLFPTIGAFNVKWNVTVPSDPSYENRTVGPFEYRAVDFTGYDFDIEVGTGETYTALAAALIYLQGQNAQNPRITFTSSGNYEWGGHASVNYKCPGYCTLEAAPGVTAWINNTAKTVQRFHGIRLRGSGVRINIGQSVLLGESGALDHPPALAASTYKPTILDGVVIDNLNGLYNKSTMRLLGILQAAGRGVGLIILDDTLCQNVIKGYKTKSTYGTDGEQTWLIRNARLENFAGADGMDGTHANIYGLTVHTQSLFWFQDEATNIAGYIKYNSAVGGAASTATWQTTAETGNVTNTLVLRKDGVVVDIIDLNTTNAIGGERTIAQIKPEIEENPGWTFTLVTDNKDAQWLAGSVDEAATSSPTPPHNCLDVEDEIYALAGYHGDVFQPYVGTIPTPRENLTHVNVKLYGIASGQAYFTFTGAAPGYNDSFLINCTQGGTMYAANPVDGFSQFGTGPFRNVHLWHCTFADQPFNFATLAAGTSPAFDAYSSIKGSVIHRWTNTASFALNAAGGISHNFMQTRLTTVPGETNILNAGSTITALIADQANGDFSAKSGGGLATIASLVPFDVNGSARGATSHIGAVA